MSDIAVLAALRELYAAPEWLVLGEVRSGTGSNGGHDITYADGLAVNLWPSADERCILFEFKVAASVRAARADLLRELKQPRKALGVGRYCSRMYIVVRAPWKLTVFDIDELPESVGLIEAGTGKPLVIRKGERRDAEPMTEAFMLSLVRSAAERGKVEEAGERHGQVMAAPMRDVTRPRVTRDVMGLSCGHTVARLMKVTPKRMRCTSCAEGLPTDLQMLDAIVREMGHAELDEAAALVERRRAAPTWAVGE